MRLRSNGAILGVLTIGAAARVVLLLDYRPSILNYPDTWGYVRAAAGPLFHHDDVRPVGYSLLLRGMHAVSPTLTFVVTMQHLMGLTTVAIAYATVRRLGQSRLVALVPASVIALSPDFLYFEHSLLSETMFALLLWAMLYAVVRALEAPNEARSRSIAWLALGGAILGSASVVRSSGLFLVIPVVAAVLLFCRGRAGSKLVSSAVVGAVAAIVVGGYAIAKESSTGSVSIGSGWALYGRAAPFADCRRFEPPPGTEDLCRPTGTVRFGGDFYGWHPESPARRAFIGPPFHDSRVGSFGLAAIRAQPGDYIRDVARDVWRFVDPGAGSPPEFSGAGPSALALDLRDPAAENLNRSVVEPYYGPVRVRVESGAEVLAALQPKLRIGGPLLVAAAMLSLVALPFSRAKEKQGLVLLASTAFAIPLISVATAVYNWRYLVPVLPELAAGGAIGASVLLRKASASRVPPPLERRMSAF